MKKNSFESPSIESETIETLSQKLLQTTNQLQFTNRELVRMQKEREEMLSNISHDLRSPITAIRNAVDLLLSGHATTEEDQQASLQLIDHRTKTLEALIQDMYYLFCVEDTAKKLDFQTLSAAPFLEEYYYDILMDNHFSSNELLLDIPESLDCYIQIDVQKMIRVLDNLFTNAKKYSAEESAITLKAALCDNDHTLCIYVIDHGIGIPSDAIVNIFQRTYTISSARTPNSKTGSGLGLSIVKAIVERHQGSVSCQSIEGKGSTFCISLPTITAPTKIPE